MVQPLTVLLLPALDIPGGNVLVGGGISGDLGGVRRTRSEAVRGKFGQSLCSDRIQSIWDRIAYHDERKLSTKGGIAKDGVGLQDLIADRKSCFCGKDSRSCDLLINQPPLDLIVAVRTLHGILYCALNESQ